MTDKPKICTLPCGLAGPLSSLAVFIERRTRAVRRVEKLEVRTFANCADRRPRAVRHSGRVYRVLYCNAGSTLIYGS